MIVLKAFRTIPLAFLLLSCTSAVSEEHESVRVAPQPEPVAEDMPEDEPGSPESVLRALHESYPERVGEPQFRDNEWILSINDRDFKWADARLLPHGVSPDGNSYARYSFRPYPRRMPPLPRLDAEEVARLEKRIAEREAMKDGRNPAFMNALWGMEDFNTAENTVVATSFLGKSVRIHPRIEGPLKNVEKQVLEAVDRDKDVRDWVNELGSAGAYVWRDIAGSANRSMHSYGIAIDLQPRDYRGLQAYWRWARDYYPEWWAIPYSERYHVPDDVVRAFEDNGFIWGGKWLLFDQIHFEYRPELIRLGEYDEQG